jgi:KDO2-lipid IV(A) lauroyltransferase
MRSDSTTHVWQGSFPPPARAITAEKDQGPGAAGVAKSRSGPSLKVFLEYIVYLCVRLMEEVVCLIPTDRRALAVGSFLGRLGFLVARDRRQVAIDNLTIAFGAERSPEEIRRIARKNFEHLGMLSVEFFRLKRWDEQQMAARLVIRGQKNFNLAWAPGSRGIFAVASHFGSFEVLAALSRFLGVRGTLVVTLAPNRFVNRRMMFDRGGADSGLNIIPHRGIVHRVIEALRAGEMVVVLADQRGDDTRAIWVDFFGRKVLANGVFAKFAIEGQAQVLPVRAVRLDDGRYLCEFGEEISVEMTDDPVHDLTVTSQRFHDIFEAWLREYPEQGFWVHRKFRRKGPRRARNGAPGLQPIRMKHEI